MIKVILSIYKSLGISGLLAAVGSRLLAKKARCFPLCIKLERFEQRFISE